MSMCSATTGRAAPAPAPRTVTATMTRNRRSRRAVTLLEVAVVAAVASIIFLLLIRWLLTLAAVDATTLSTGQAARATNYVDARLSADLAAAAGCTTYTASPLRELSPTTLALYTSGGRTDGSTGMQLVVWNLDTASGLLTRWSTPIVDTAGCTSPPAAPAVGSRPVMADQVSTAGGARTFTALSGGADAGDCSVISGAPTGAACRAGAVSVTLSTATGGLDPGHSTLARTYTLKGSH